jgi:hypothetical protein
MPSNGGKGGLKLHNNPDAANIPRTTMQLTTAKAWRRVPGRGSPPEPGASTRIVDDMAPTADVTVFVHHAAGAMLAIHAACTAQADRTREAQVGIVHCELPLSCMLLLLGIADALATNKMQAIPPNTNNEQTNINMNSVILPHMDVSSLASANLAHAIHKQYQSQRDRPRICQNNRNAWSLHEKSCDDERNSWCAPPSAH